MSDIEQLLDRIGEKTLEGLSEPKQKLIGFLKELATEKGRV